MILRHNLSLRLSCFDLNKYKGYVVKVNKTTKHIPKKQKLYALIYLHLVGTKAQEKDHKPFFFFFPSNSIRILRASPLLAYCAPFPLSLGLRNLPIWITSIDRRSATKWKFSKAVITMTKNVTYYRKYQHFEKSILCPRQVSKISNN